jgi:hypothetical protein
MLKSLPRLVLGLLALAVGGCSGGSGGIAVPPAALGAARTGASPVGTQSGLVNADAFMRSQTPKSGGFQIQSGRSMPQSASVALAAGTARSVQSVLIGNQWTQLPGGVSYLAASPDGSIWGIWNSQFNGPDGLIVHYVNGTWYSVAGGYAVRVAVGPDGTAYAVQSSGNVWVLRGGVWAIVGCCAADVSVASDGSLYAAASGTNALYHYANGVLTQLPGAGFRIVGSWDGGTYPNSVNPGGYYVVAGGGSLYYYSPGVGYLLFPGSVAQVAPTGSGGIFGTGSAVDSVGNHPISYFDLRAQTWTQQPGGAASISAAGSAVDISDGLGVVYTAGINAAGSNAAAPLTGPNVSAYNLWGPTALANALQFPVQSGYNGTGITIAVIDASTIYSDDLNAFLTELQTPITNRTFTVKYVAGGSSSPRSSSIDEATLDVETLMSLAPGANVVEYVIPNLNTQSLYAAYNQIMADGQASIVSVSLGGCETSMSSSSLSAFDALFSQAAQAGIVFIASSGDQGSACSNGNIYQFGVSYPASDPNVIGVGGTETISPTGQITSLTSTIAWNDTYFGQQLASGGGVSTTFAVPSYQSNVSGPSSRQFRNVPDIAMPAVGDVDRLKGNWYVAGGTSWGAPQFAAMLAEIYQFCGVTKVTNAASLPYTVSASAGYNAFVDVVSGNNSFLAASGGPTFGYSAGPGYDNVSGIGVPLGMPFANALCPNHVLASAARRPAQSVALQVRPAQAYRADATPKVAGLTDLGPRNPSEITSIQVVVSPAGSIATNEQHVIDVLQAAGLTVDATYGNHLLVAASGPTSAVEQLFSTQIDNVAQAADGSAYMPVTPITVPASLAPDIAGVTLDTIATFSRVRSPSVTPQTAIRLR